MKKKQLIFFLIFAVTIFLLPATPSIQFSGGQTKIIQKNGISSIKLTDNAYVKTDKIEVRADEMTISGADHDLISCTNNVSVVMEEQGITLKTAHLEYNRNTNIIRTTGWVEIQDIKDEASLSGAWLEYNIEEETLHLEMYAGILKSTSKGLMKCSADIIHFSIKEKTLSLEGEANVEWGTDQYNASLISVNLDTEEISMSGSIDGTVNG